MKRLIVFVLPFLYMAIGYAQLNKFVGSWIHKSSIIYPEADQILPSYKIFKITIEDAKVYVRLKEIHRTQDGNELKEYFRVNNIQVKGDSLISCNVYFSPLFSSCYKASAIESDYTPNTHSKFVGYEEYEIYEMSIHGGVLTVNVPSLIQEFYMDGNMVDKNIIKRNYDFDCYNENDNW